MKERDYYALRKEKHSTFGEMGEKSSFGKKSRAFHLAHCLYVRQRVVPEGLKNSYLTD